MSCSVPELPVVNTPSNTQIEKRIVVPPVLRSALSICPKVPRLHQARLRRFDGITRRVYPQIAKIYAVPGVQISEADDQRAAPPHPAVPAAYAAGAGRPSCPHLRHLRNLRISRRQVRAAQ